MNVYQYDWRENLRTINGYIKSKKSVIFRDEKNWYTIAKFITENEDEVSIKWPFLNEIPKGVIKIFIEKTTEHERYGISYDFKHFEVPEPKSLAQIILFLTVTFWLTKNQTDKILRFFNHSSNLLELLDVHIKEHEGEENLWFVWMKKLFSKDSKYWSFCKKWKEEALFRSIRLELLKYKLSENNIKDIVEKYQDQSLEKIQENPYVLVWIEGIGFPVADLIFLKRWWDRKAEERILASLPHVILEQCNKSKWLYLHIHFYEFYVNKKLNFVWEDMLSREEIIRYTKMLDENTENNKIVPWITKPLLMVKEEVNWEQLDIVFLASFYNWEMSIAQACYQASIVNFPKIDLSNESWEIDWRKLNEQQIEAVKNWINSKISIITWQGWTWKSTIIKKIIQIINANRDNFNWKEIRKLSIEKLEKKVKEYIIKTKDKKSHDYLENFEKLKELEENLERTKNTKETAFNTYTLLAPTWKAVDVLIDISWEPDHCSTIHRKTWIQWKEWINAVNSITELITIVDEASMMATPLMYSLITSIDWFMHDETKRLILVWDDNQLPPISYWKPFLDMMNSWIIPITKLTKVYRQQEGSRILENCQCIVEKKPFQYEDTEDFKFFDIQYFSPQKIQNNLMNEIKHNKWNNKNDVILTFQRKWWAAWINEINTVMQNYLNKDNWKMFFEKGLNKFFIWDRVMQKQNWYRGWDKEKDWTKEGYPVSLLTNKNKMEELWKFFNENSSDWSERSILYKWGYEPFSKDIVYHISTNSFLNMESFNWKTIWTYENWKLKEKLWEKFEGDLDRNVYNWNWGIVVAAKTEQWWYWINELTNKIEKLHIDVLLPPKKKDERDEYTILVKFNNQYVFYNRDVISDLILFYASSVHKSQGSQFKNVYAINSPKDSFWTDRYWLYTQLSRAQEQIYYFSTKDITFKTQYKEWSLLLRTSLLVKLLKKKYEDYQNWKIKDIEEWEDIKS